MTFSSPPVIRVDPATNKVAVVQPIRFPAAEWIALSSRSGWMRNQTLGAVQRYDAAAWTAPSALTHGFPGEAAASLARCPAPSRSESRSR
jgi:hypothetical protein